MSRSRRLASSAATPASGGYPTRSALQRPMLGRLSGGPGVRALVVFYATYMLAAGFGRWMMVIPDIPITVWPPNGVILAMLLTRPRSTWPWWIAAGAAGELTGNLLWFHNPLVWALGYVVANAAAVTTAAFLLFPHLLAPIRRLASLRQVLAFLGLGVLGAPVVSATLGSGIDVLAGKNAFVTTWPVWWLGDATGILIATPLVISTVNVWRDRVWPTAAQLLEGAAIALVLAALGIWELRVGAGYAFLLPIPVLWAALRFEFRGATLAVLGLALVIGFHAQNITFPVGSDAGPTLLHTRLQVLVLVAASTGLIVAAIVRQQRQAVFDLACANSDLEARVAERTRAIEAAEQRFKATFENAGVGISIVGDDGRLLRVNDRLARMLGYAVDEMEGQSLDRFTHPDDLALGDVAWDRLETGAADTYELEKRYLRKDGEPVWGHTTVSCVRHSGGRIAYLIKITQDISARKRSDEARQYLMREVNHRSKNLLAIVQAIARQTAARSPQEFLKSFGERLRALAANHDLLVKSEWRRVSLTDLVKSQLEHFDPVGGRIRLSGPPVTVPPAAAQALGMALHELATNATKYGSLSNEAGQVAVSWTVEDDFFAMSWRETGGPQVVPPGATGFGTTLLHSLTVSSLSGEVDVEYPPEGVVWRLRIPLTALQDNPDEDGLA